LENKESLEKMVFLFRVHEDIKAKMAKMGKK
jgi:hypothetical protein